MWNKRRTPVGRGDKDKDGGHSQPCRWRYTKTTHISVLNLYPTLISSSGREGLPGFYTEAAQWLGLRIHISILS